MADEDNIASYFTISAQEQLGTAVDFIDRASILRSTFHIVHLLN